MFLLVGLGNIGQEYNGTRHNIGFAMIDIIAEKQNLTSQGVKYKGEVFSGNINGTKTFCIKPHTLMNLSGISVSQIANFYKIPLDNIYVFHDDMDIKLGKVKVKNGGGSGGHNGIKSLDAHLGNSYNRVRLGISHPQQNRAVHNYVLGKFSAEENTEVDMMLENINNNLETLLFKGREDFLTDYNKR